MNLKNLLLAVLAALLFLPSTFAYDVKTITKKNKKLIKQIKKQNEADVVTTVVSEDSSYYYFEVINMDGKVGVADYSGKLIVPIEYISVYYNPAVEEGISHVECCDAYSSKKDDIMPGVYMDVYHKKTDASFFAVRSDGGDFYNLEGRKVLSSNCNLVRTLPGYVILNKGKHADYKKLYGLGYSTIPCRLLLWGGKDNPLTILHSDGTIIDTGVLEIEFIAPDIVRRYKTIDNINRYGVLNLRDAQKNIPCNYRTLKVDSGKIIVQKNDLDTLVAYYPELDKNGITYIDEGERLYSMYKWSAVVDFYKSKGDSAQWGYYISAQALYNRVSSGLYFIMRAIQDYDADSTKLSVDLKSSLYSIKNLEESNEICKSAKVLNDAYLACSDTIYKNQARKLHKELNNVLLGFESNKAKLSKMHEKKKIELKAQRDREIEKEAQERQRKLEAQIRAQERQKELEAQKRARQQQVALSIISAISNVATQVTTKSSNSNSLNSSNSQSSSSLYMQNNATTVKQNSVSKPDNSGRKAFLRGEIITWKNKLKKAENSYRQALESGEDTWQKKRVIDSKRKTVDECLEMIRQYEAELNSLK